MKLLRAAFLALLWLGLACAPAIAGLGNPVVVGSTAGSSGSGTCSGTTTASVTAGSTVVMFAEIVTTGTLNVSSISFNSTSMTAAVSPFLTGASTIYLAVYYLDNVSASSGVTYSIVSNATSSVSCTIIYITGTKTSSSLDQAVTNQGHHSNPSVTTGTLAQANEIVLGFLYDGAAGGPTAPGSPWAAIPSFTTTWGSGTILGDYQIVSSTSAVTYNPTAATSTYGIIAAAFKAPSSATKTYPVGFGVAPVIP